MRETRIAGRRVYEGRIVCVDVDEVRLAHGGKAVREVVRHPGAVVVVPLLDGDRVLLERQFRYPIDDVLLELPAGKLDAGEAPLACARRELAEETGYAAARWELLSTYLTAPGFCDEVMFCYLARDLTAAPDPPAADADEHIELVELPLASALAAVLDGTIRDAKSIIGVLLAVRRLETEGKG